MTIQNTYDWLSEHLVPVKEIEGYNSSSRLVAMDNILNHDGLLTGIIYQDISKVSYQELLHGYSQEPLSYTDLALEKEYFERLSAEFY